MKGLIFVKNIDWTQLWYIVGIVVVFWGGLATFTVIFPAFDIPYKVVNTLLSAAGAATLFAARGGKYVEDRSQVPPADGKV